MSTTYHAVHWNAQKRAYDTVILALVFTAIVTFATVTLLLHPNATIETLLMRGTAFVTIFLLQVLLCIGPLARLSPKFLPLLYNRRHLGITIFLLATVHATIALIQHHVLGDTFPLISVFSAYAYEYAQVLRGVSGLKHIPFEPFGVAALVVLYFMAITSHDFWLRLLGASQWKLIHMLVYPAYALLLLHVSFGFFQSELHYVYPLFVYGGFLLVVTLHLLAAWKGRRETRAMRQRSEDDPFVAACPVSDVEEAKGKSIRLGKTRIALFRSKGKIFALSGVCRHQGGPIGEGRIIDGCITCPWHGWQYHPEDGESPPPFDEHVSTFAVELRGDHLFVNPMPLPRGTVCDGTRVPYDGKASTAPEESDEFYVGYQKVPPKKIHAFLNGLAVFLLMALPLFMALVAAGQSTYDYGYFEFGSHHELEGIYYATPVPTLYVTPQWPKSPVEGTHILLCGIGKFGVPESWSTMDGKKVMLAGSIVYRDQLAMLEVNTDEIPPVIGEPTEGEMRPVTEAVTPINLVGELVDTKCYMGVMRPATGKVHRACAIRCLSGGIPPSILVESGDYATAILLAGPEGEALDYDVTLAGLRIRVEGTLYRENGFSYIRADRLTPFDVDESPPE